MRRRLTAALLLLLHAILLTSGGVPASASATQTPYRAAGVHSAHVDAGPRHHQGSQLAAGRPAARTPAHATRPAQGDPPRVQAGAGGAGASGGPVVLPNPAAPRGGTRVTRAGPHHDGPPAQFPRRPATARAPPSTAY
ncbi:hypothetical protein [Microbispora bryophytorum]|uniref:Secreted protein n=1 Tax=Microbispora bryophytorum TaxID=1460882 RepID=A0A8H9GWP2_9ACTN|nr:hypothetical protein [Microbispora bryophytorum]MBD3137157.1 hypothetical protein [Microbispora bryophytorum]TQS06635.1 hypothetical protein FLX07_12125 [Microbispora bryophytorum]GGO07184.1 hypothetical protein GCM10011574_20430 [Microbispora bryophytorum]